MKPTVLIVEDSRDIQKLYEEFLIPHAEILQAFDQESARKLFTDRHPIDCVIMDGNVPATSDGSLSQVTRSTDGLIQFIRATGFVGPILAVAGDPRSEELMLAAGCSEFHVKNERGLMDKLISTVGGP